MKRIVSCLVLISAVSIGVAGCDSKPTTVTPTETHTPDVTENEMNSEDYEKEMSQMK